MIADGCGHIFDRIEFLDRRGDGYWPLVFAQTCFVPTWWLWAGVLAIAVALDDEEKLYGNW